LFTGGNKSRQAFSPISLSARVAMLCVRAQSTPPYVLLLLEKAVRRVQIFAPYQRTRCERDASHQPRFVVSGCEQREREKQSASLSPFLPRRLPCFAQKVDACAPFSGFWDIFYQSEAVARCAQCGVGISISSPHEKGLKVTCRYNIVHQNSPLVTLEQQN